MTSEDPPDTHPEDPVDGPSEVDVLPEDPVQGDDDDDD